MNTNLKKALLIFGGGIILFWAFKKIKPLGRVKGAKPSSSTKKISEKDKKDAAIVLSAYKAAVQAGEQKSFLDEMNAEFAKEYKLKVYTDKGTGKLFVANLEGTKIL